MPWGLRIMAAFALAGFLMPGAWLFHINLPPYLCPFAFLAMIADNGLSFFGGVGLALLIATCNAAYYAIFGLAVSVLTYPLWKSN